MQKLLMASTILATAFAAVPPYYGAPPPASPYALSPIYAPAYAPSYAPSYAQAYAPAYFSAPAYKPFAYGYGAVDDFTRQLGGEAPKRTESQDDEGNVSGSIIITLPGGRIQTTTYKIDRDNGFVADVTYDDPTYDEASQPDFGPRPTFKGQSFWRLIKRTESQDSNGAVKGSYVITLPDGRIQTTTYAADPVKGYSAKITYDGSQEFSDKDLIPLAIED